MSGTLSRQQDLVLMEQNLEHNLGPRKKIQKQHTFPPSQNGLALFLYGKAVINNKDQK